MMKQPFYLTKRKLKKGKKIYYYYYYKNDGTRSVPKSTGFSNKQQAFNYCLTLFQRYGFENDRIKFKDYAKDWFTPQSRWYKNKSLSKSIRQRTIISFTSILNVRLIPFFGEMYLDEITPANVRDFRIGLSKELKNSTINVTIGVFNIIMNYAVEENYIKKSPVTKSVSRLTEDTQREAYSLDELKQLLVPEWEPYDAWLFILTAAVTGLRLSELIGLQPDQLHDNYIDVCHQWAVNKLDFVKTGENRFVTCPPVLISMLKEYCDERDFIFWSKTSYGSPIGQQYIKYYLYKHYTDEMERKRKEVKLTFHSLRHFFNTYLVFKNIQESKINFIIGHSTKKGSMLNLYTTWKPEMYQDVLEVQTDLLKELGVI